MEKRLLIAMGISLAILLVFSNINKRNAQQQVIADKQPAQTSVNKEVAPPPAKQAFDSFTPASSLSENEILIQTDIYDIVFSDIGGTVKRMTLLDKDEDVLVSKAGKNNFSMSSPLIAGLNSKKFKVVQGTGYVKFIYTEPDWFEVTKKYTYYKSNYDIGLEIQVKNLSSREATFSYSLLGPANLNSADKVSGRNFLQADIMIDGGIWRAKSAKGGQVDKTGIISWAAIKNRYYAQILKPEELPASATLKQLEDKSLEVILNSKTYTLSPGSTKTDMYLYYAGPLDEKKIAAISSDMAGVVDYGKLGGISKILLAILRFYHNFVGNWGVAIILLTITVNLVLFPLTMKSFKSMQQMKKIQPHMEKLKALHKDNPQKLNKEMMELYKKYNVNPLGGCLPMLLQMPVFFALYTGLVRSIELKGAGFLWITDLSRPDAVPLPFTLPLIGSSINILPLLMVGMMVVQQKMSQGATPTASPEQASQQKMMMVMFPLLFGFLFYRMPSGLVLYWLTNTILMASEQKLIALKVDKE